MPGRLSAPEIDARAYAGILAVAQRVQIAVGAVALLALWTVGDVPMTEKVTVTVLLVFVYLPWALLSPRLALRASRAVNMAVDLLAVAVFPLISHETLLAVMAAYMLVVCFHAYVSGRPAGLTASAGALAIVGIADWRAAAPDRLDTFTLVMYAATLLAMTVMVDGLAAERRALVRHLSRLNSALSEVTPEPDLDRTLRSVAKAARSAVDAGFVVVLLERDGRIDATTQVSTRDLSPVASSDELQAVLDAMVEDPMSTPSGVALATSSLTTSRDILDDARFVAWRPIAEKLGIRSVVSVPLTSDAGSIGVLAAYSPDAGAFTAADAALLDAYARQAALAVARAIAFERERTAVLQLADADRIKSEFVARVSHELRTPLTAIHGFISTVLTHWDTLDERAKQELLTRAGRNTSDLRRLVEQVLVFARTGDHGAEVATKPLPLGAEIQTLVMHLAPVLARHTVTVDVDADLVVVADREALHHVLTNLLANAAKFAPDGTQISLSARRVVGDIEVSVRDDGPGIAPGEHQRIFERFYRASGVAAKGTGIGLSIVESFVSKMGGRVWVESTPGEGATFTFTLPAGDPAEATSPAAPATDHARALTA